MAAPKPWRTAAASLAFLAAPALAADDEPFLVRDIYPGEGPPLGSQPVLIQTEGGPAFLFANDEEHGRELWVSDGTAAGTRLVRDVCPGRCSSRPVFQGFLGGRLLFSAQSAEDGPFHLWISDGTWEGTRALGSGPITGFAAVGILEDRGLFFFAADYDGMDGLWMTDGTPGGTRPLALDGPDGWPLFPTGFTTGTGSLVFTGGSIAGYHGPWVTDGTDQGTRQLGDFTGGRFYDLMSQLVRLGGLTTFFVRTVGEGSGCIAELWSTDGRLAGTTLLATFEDPFCQGPPPVSAVRSTAGALWFAAQDGEEPRQLWTSDGTPAGTEPLTAFAGDAFAERVLTAGTDSVFFSADDGVHGLEPWLADAAGARLLADLCAGPCSSSPGAWYPGTFYFSANDGVHGRELWRVEGAAAVLVDDLCPGSCSSSPAPLAAAGGRVYFAAGDLSIGAEAWATPLGGNGATRLTDFASEDPFPFGSSFFSSAAAVDDRIVFTADDGVHGIEVWGSDGTPAGTALAADLDPRIEMGAGSEPVHLTPWGSRLLFFAREPDLGYQPWVSDGTEAGTVRLGIVTGPDEPFVPRYSKPVVLGADALFLAADARGAPLALWRVPAVGAPVRVLELPFTASIEPIASFRLGSRALFLIPGSGDESGLWASDGTAGGTRALGALQVSTAGGGEPAAELGGRLFFAALDDPFASGFDLWSTDGTPGGTGRVAVIGDGGQPPNPGEFARLGGLVLFAATGDGGRELWATDGTAPGTRRVADLSANGSSSPRGLTTVGDSVFFFAAEEGSLALWKTDGTAGGTVRLGGVPSIDSFPADTPKRAAAGGRFYFVTAGIDRPDLWVSDGTVAGTGSLRPLLPERADVRGVWSGGDRARVSLNDFGAPDVTSELWETDGTLAGTRRRVSLAPIGFPEPISRLAEVGPLLYFRAPHPEAGPEPMALPVGPPAPCAADAETLCLRDGRFAVRARWRDPRSGDQGTGGALSLPGSDRTGLFWFFAPDNVELVFKTLDGGGVNGFFWNFYGALTDVEYTIEVEDTATGRRTEYFNPGGEICGRGDTTAFPARPPVPLPVPPPFFAPVRSAAAPGGGGTACGGQPGDLCLFGDRFRVEVEWADQRSGDSGVGTAIPFADRSGFFWFFEPQNVELVVKILDGRTVNGRFWVFFGGLSDVEYTITVTDTVTDEQAVYQNAQGDICGRGDTTAF